MYSLHILQFYLFFDTFHQYNIFFLYILPNQFHQKSTKYPSKLCHYFFTYLVSISRETKFSMSFGSESVLTIYWIIKFKTENPISINGKLFNEIIFLQKSAVKIKNISIIIPDKIHSIFSDGYILFYQDYKLYCQSQNNLLSDYVRISILS